MEAPSLGPERLISLLGFLFIGFALSILAFTTEQLTGRSFASKAPSQEPESGKKKPAALFTPRMGSKLQRLELNRRLMAILRMADSDPMMDGAGSKEEFVRELEDVLEVLREYQKQ